MSGVCVPASICPINVIAIVPQRETFDIGEFPTLVCNSFDMPCCRISLTIDDELRYILHYHKDAIESVSFRKFLSLEGNPSEANVKSLHRFGEFTNMSHEDTPGR